MRVHGACIISNFFTPSDDDDDKPLFTCDKRQAGYILKTNTPREEVFNGVKKMSKTSVYKTYLTGTVSGRLRKGCPRITLQKCKVNHTAMAEYQYQMDLLLQNIFPPKEGDKRKPKNWKTKMQNLVGGNTYQHPHADQGRPGEYKEERTFPFVATHGFGLHEFELWLLPATGGQYKHGFLHRFPSEALILMRGDFVHAGGVVSDPRCHMEFYPKVPAGLVFDHAHHYWLEEDFRCNIDEPPQDEDKALINTDASFLWQGLSFPFAYPVAEYVENTNGKVRTVLTYPPTITEHLISTRKTPERELAMRTVTSQRF
jgi:hypothetical protein